MNGRITTYVRDPNIRLDFRSLLRSRLVHRVHLHHRFHRIQTRLLRRRILRRMTLLLRMNFCVFKKWCMKNCLGLLLWASRKVREDVIVIIAKCLWINMHDIEACDMYITNKEKLTPPHYWNFPLPRSRMIRLLPAFSSSYPFDHYHVMVGVAWLIICILCLMYLF